MQLVPLQVRVLPSEQCTLILAARTGVAMSHAEVAIKQRQAITVKIKLFMLWTPY
jgi:hypothetical protein